jgi:hypothetical protein
VSIGNNHRPDYKSTTALEYTNKGLDPVSKAQIAAQARDLRSSHFDLGNQAGTGNPSYRMEF